jgi:hypothetical protein
MARAASSSVRRGRISKRNGSFVWSITSTVAPSSATQIVR